MKTKTLLITFLLALSFGACKKHHHETPKAQNFMTWKVDGTPYSADPTMYEGAKYEASNMLSTLAIYSFMKTLSVTLSLMPENNYIGTFKLGEKNNANSWHFALISYGPNGQPTNFNKDTRVANGLNNTSGSVSITLFDTLSMHRIEGTFQGKFYNDDQQTYKQVTEGKFSLPLTVIH